MRKNRRAKKERVYITVTYTPKGGVYFNQFRAGNMRALFALGKRYPAAVAKAVGHE